MAGVALAMLGMVSIGLNDLMRQLSGVTSVIDFTNDALGSVLFLTGLVVLVIGGLLFAFKAIPPQPNHVGGWIGIAVVLILIGLFAAQFTSAPTAAIVQVPGATVSSYIVSSGLPSGCTVNSVTATETCDAVYNYTSGAFAISATNTDTFKLPTYILFDIHSARTDGLNQTAGISYAVSSVATVTTTGSNPTTYSPIVGYVPASGTSNGVWKAYWGSGSAANLNPSNNAPTSASGWTPSMVGIAAFGGSSNTLHISLPGGNSTSAPAALYSALTLYGSYSMTVTVSGSTPSTFTLTMVIIGEHA